MPTSYPSIYNNTYVYSQLKANSIVLTTDRGFSEVTSAANTILICDASGTWKTDSLDNYATSKEIEDLQDYDNTLKQSITNNITAIANLQQDLDENYFEKGEANEQFIDNSELSTSLSKYVLISDYNTKVNELTSSIGTNGQNISSLQTDVGNLITSTQTNLASIEDIQSKSKIELSNTYSNLDTLVNNLSATTTISSGNYFVTGNISIYINDITLMTPKDEFISDVNWLKSLPILKIEIGASPIVISDIILETNRPLIVLPVCDYIELTGQQQNVKFTITIPNAEDINVTTANIFMYKYKLTFKQVI